MFNNLHELIAKMPDEKNCRDYLVQQRWQGKPICPYCGHEKTYVIEGGKRFKCASKACYKKFSVTVGTIFEASNVPLNKWFMAIYLCTAHKKGISSYQLGKNIGVSQKSAWFMLHRIRELMRPKKPVILRNMIEADITYIGGKQKNKSNKERKKILEQKLDWRHGKTVVLGITERRGATMMQIVKLRHAEGVIKEHVEPISSIVTDEGGEFRNLHLNFNHYTVIHSNKEFARGIYHTNSIEGTFSHLKRMVIGIYHHFSPWHTPAYLDEFNYRWNTRKMKDADRFRMALTQTTARMPYKTLVARNVLSLKYEAPK